MLACALSWGCQPEVAGVTDRAAGTPIADYELEVTAVSGPPSAWPWGTFQTQVTVCNRGIEPIYGVEVAVVLSTDDDISWTEDIVVGDEWISHLWVRSCVEVSVNTSANVPPGAYYLGAIVDPHDLYPEPDETNNAAAGNLIGIGSDPDLVVAAVSGALSVYPWEPLRVNATVCNQGQDIAFDVDVHVVLSTDEDISMSDLPLGNEVLYVLGPGSCTVVAVEGPAPPGTHVIGAVVDGFDQIPELIETNNATAGNVVSIGYKPDLVVTDVSGPASVAPWDSVPINATVCNHGTEMSPSTDIHFFMSSDEDIDVTDFLIGWENVPALSPGGCTTIWSAGPNHAADGVYWLGAIVDLNDYVDELRDDNNSLAGSIVRIGLGPDLIVSSVVGPPSVEPSATFSATATVCNQGTMISSASHVWFVLSPDKIIDASDMQVGVRALPQIHPGHCVAITVDDAYASSGGPATALWLGAIVTHAAQPELDDTNNSASGGQIGIGYGPDLVVTDMSGPASSRPWESFDVAVTVCNQGTAPSGAFDVSIRLSVDEEITEQDDWIGYGQGMELNPGSCTTIQGYGYAASLPGVYWLGAIVDPYDHVDELIETNNAVAGGVFAVGNKPDLVVTEVSSPPDPAPWIEFPVTATVCNQGTEDFLGWTWLSIMRATSATSDMDDFPLVHEELPPLERGQCVQITRYAYTHSGAFILKAIVDPLHQVDELIETNNITLGNYVWVSH